MILKMIVLVVANIKTRPSSFIQSAITWYACNNFWVALSCGTLMFSPIKKVSPLTKN